MILRRAELKDQKALVALALEQTTRYPRLRPDKKKIEKLVIECISSAACFAEVVEDEEQQVQGCLLSITSSNLWAERRLAAVLLWVSKVRGAGVKLLRRFRNWVDSRLGIRVSGVSKEIDWDPRIDLLLIRTGFQRYGGNFYRYN